MLPQTVRWRAAWQPHNPVKIDQKEKKYERKKNFFFEFFYLFLKGGNQAEDAVPVTRVSETSSQRNGRSSLVLCKKVLVVFDAIRWHGHELTREDTEHDKLFRKNQPRITHLFFFSFFQFCRVIYFSYLEKCRHDRLAKKVPVQRSLDGAVIIHVVDRKDCSKDLAYVLLQNNNKELLRRKPIYLFSILTDMVTASSAPPMITWSSLRAAESSVATGLLSTSQPSTSRLTESTRERNERFAKKESTSAMI